MGNTAGAQGADLTVILSRVTDAQIATSTALTALASVANDLSKVVYGRPGARSRVRAADVRGEYLAAAAALLAAAEALAAVAPAVQELTD
jgi:hypothetical protein